MIRWLNQFSRAFEGSCRGSNSTYNYKGDYSYRYKEFIELISFHIFEQCFFG